ncbi:MAG TPA: ATP-binding protein [Actinomycetota bacterium]|nr:ATP-binding protein [Actinomycetota bacterium]
MSAALPSADTVSAHRDRGRLFAAAVSVGGLAVLAGLIPRIDTAAIRADPAVFWLCAGLAVAGELMPIRAPRAGQVEEVGISTTFGMAILLVFGTAAAAAVFGFASLVGDVVNRKSPWKTVFNIAQYVLSVAAAGAVYALFGGPHEMSAAVLGPLTVAAAAFLVVNDGLTGTAIALSRGVSIRAYLLDDLVFQAATAAALCALAPVVVVLAETDVWLVPLMVVPVAAVYLGATASLHNTELVHRLERALEQEKELGRMKDDFAAVVSHELRTPLTSIQGYIKTMLQLGPRLADREERSFLEAADRQSDRLRRLIDQLLAVSRLESEVEPLTLTPVSVPDVARHVVEELQASGHGQTFDLRFDPDLRIVETDEGKVHQIVSNLVENALKYSPPDTKITVRGAAMADGLVVSVENEGSGIPEEAQKRIFDRFYQVDGSATRSVGGTGLGLYICRKLADAIGGRLWLERSGPDGTVFRLWIPDGPPVPADEDAGAAAVEAGVSR